MLKKSLQLAFCSLLLGGCYSQTSGSDTGNVYAPAASVAYTDNAVMNSEGRAKSVRMMTNSDSAAGFFQQSDRMMAYTSGFTLVVKERQKALDEVKALAEKLGGYLVSSARGNMQLKVPVKKADEFLKTAGTYGELSDFRISAEDLTDTITDLGVRLENLRKLRVRLTELLAKAKNVDEMLKVERELNRVTTEIERIDALLQNNKNRVDFVTFDVAIIEQHGAIPGGTPQAIDQFRFLKKLGGVLVGDEDEPLFDIALPENFTPITEGQLQSDSFAATTSDDCIFRTWEVDVADGSTLEFWEKMVCRALSAFSAYDQIKSFPVEFEGRKAVKITAQLTTSRGVENYLAVISVKRSCGDDELQIVEFFGPLDAFAKHEKAVTSAILK